MCSAPYYALERSGGVSTVHVFDSEKDMDAWIERQHLPAVRGRAGCLPRTRERIEGIGGKRALAVHSAVGGPVFHKRRRAERGGRAKAPRQ